jgi:adenylate kinase
LVGAPRIVVMSKRVILVTGTPCVGKTTVAKALAAKLSAEYINLTDFAKTHNLITGQDLERDTLIIDEEKMRQTLAHAIGASENQNVVVDSHYAAAVAPADNHVQVFVLRRHPRELKALMEQRGYSGQKLWENLQAEIIDVVLGEAVEAHAGRVCELDATGKPVEVVVGEILDVLEKRKNCFVGTVDWIGTLEREGVLDDYLKT